MRFLPFYLVISGLFCIFALTNFRNMVYYRYLFKHSWGLSPNEGLVYSALLSHSLMTSEHFDVDGDFDVELAKAYIHDNLEIEGKECISYDPISTRRLARLLNMSENTVRKIKDDLENKHHLIHRGLILCPLRLLDMGFIDVDIELGLKGLQLLFYGLLRDRSRLLHGTIDTWAVRLAELMGVSKKDIYNLLSILQRKGLVERLKDGKLKIK